MSKAVAELRVFGIRHHGPGSARRLREALEQWQPNYLLVEFPADGQPQLDQLQHLAPEPPVAIVLYDAKDIQSAYYYPFARFSPEWQAVTWAHQNGVPAEAMDLPISIQLGLKAEQQQRLDHAKTDPQLLRDPLGEMARLAGYQDREQWWEITFEKVTDDLALFDAVNELMTTLRQEAREQSRETLLREAYMRKCLRKALKDGHERVAVVCGAWHNPALSQWTNYPAKADSQVLRGLKKIKTAAAWIPWSYPRLARESGYGAGVHSPAWYELLYDYGREATIHWMVQAAQLLREQGMDASPAHAQEAVRLAYTLATLREQRIPSLADLRSAALTTLCNGDDIRLQLIEARLQLGTKVGTVPENAAVVPLQKDLTRQLKTSRLNKYWGTTGEQYLKATKANPLGGIDLRTDNDLLKSHLLHRLQILDIPWGVVQSGTGNELGAFKEIWKLQWQPEYSLHILEAAMWGNTVAEAADNKLQQPTPDATLPELARLVLLGLRAGLRQGVQTVTEQLRERSALTHNVQELLAALPALIRIIQYGDARKTDVTALALLVEEIAPRLAAALPGAVMQIDQEAADLLIKDFQATHRGLCQLNLPLLEAHWWPAVARLAELPGIAPLLKGFANRLLFDSERQDLDTTARRLDYALSPGNEALEVTQWLSGFLRGSGLLLVHHPPLWNLIDRWVKALPMDELDDLLPLLRRTFSAYSPHERQQLLGLVREVTQPPATATKAAATTPIEAEVTTDRLTQQLLEGVDGWIG